MIDLKKLSLSELKLIIKEYKNYISIKLVGLKKDDLIKLINKFNITLTNEDNKKIKLIIEKKEKKLNIPKVLTPAEKEAKEKKIEKQKIKNKQLIKEWAKKEADTEIEQLKKEGKYDYDTPTPKKEKVEFNFTALYIPTKLKQSNYSKEQLYSLYGDYEDDFTDDKLNNIAKIMKENDKYKYVYDRFIEFVKYFKDTKIKYYINDLISYDYDFFDMPNSKKTRLPFFRNRFYNKTVGANKIGHDDYVNYIKKAIKDIKATEDIKTESISKPTTDIKELQKKLHTLYTEYYSKLTAENVSSSLTSKRKKWALHESPQEYKQQYEKIQLLLKNMGIVSENLKTKEEWKKSNKPKKEPKVKVVKPKKEKEDNKKFFFTKQRRDELLLLRKKDPLIGDIINNNITHYEKLILPNNGRQLNNNIKLYNPKKYKLLTEYVNNNKKINILKFINNQIERHTGPKLFYPPYLQNYIALNGLYIVYRFFEILFKLINKNIIIIPKTNAEINQYENEYYPYLKDLSLNEKTSIRTKYHNFLYDDVKHYNDYYLTYYS